MGKGIFVVVDGITGSGKSTVLGFIRDWTKSLDKKIFDLYEWSDENSDPPHFDNIKDYDIFFTFEPTRQWVGATIRREMAFGKKYCGKSLAHAFALDRQIQYNRLIIPALQNGKIVIQDRSVTSSIVYQPMMKDGPSTEEIQQIPGNALALENAPDHLIITNLQPEIAVERMKHRSESKGVFEDLELLKKNHERFFSDWFNEIFEQRGTKIHQIDTSKTKEEMQKDIVDLFERILPVKTQIANTYA